MYPSDVSLALLQLGCFGVLWSGAYLALSRITPMSLVPAVLEGRVRRRKRLAPLVLVIATVAAVCGAAASV